MLTNTVERKITTPVTPTKSSGLDVKNIGTKSKNSKNQKSSEQNTPVKKLTRNGLPVHRKFKVERVIKVFQTSDILSPEYKEMWLHFGEVLWKAVQHGKIATPERMIALYPILREIADEANTLI